MPDTESPLPELSDSEFPTPQYRDVEDAPEKIWTLRRILLLLIAIMVIVALVTTFFIAPILTPHRGPSHPLPTPTALPQI